jgi:protein gp37
MSESSKISWCDSTFNGWIGCTKASPGCLNCYAETMMDHHWGKAEWGPKGQRIRTSDMIWKSPEKWNKQLFCECPACGWRGTYPTTRRCYDCNGYMPQRFPARRRVFAHSLSDVFEERPDLDNWRHEEIMLWSWTPRLDWLVLTKHPYQMLKHSPAEGYPNNVATGVSVENQEFAERRIPILTKVRSSVKFLSVEPMLGPVDLSKWLPDIGWVICGAESGSARRPFQVEWAVDLYYQCQKAHVPFFMKQGSAFKSGQQGTVPDYLWEVKEFPIIVGG